MDRKQLALAVNFGKAPVEIQNAAKAANDLQKQIEKLKSKQRADADELLKLEIQAGEADKALRKLLAAWDPATVEAKA